MYSGWICNNKQHQSIRKAESSLAIQLRTERIGFAAFLHTPRVLDIVSPACQCGWRREDPKHHVIFCPTRGPNRRSLYEAAVTSRYEERTTSAKELRAQKKKQWNGNRRLRVVSNTEHKYRINSEVRPNFDIRPPWL